MIGAFVARISLSLSAALMAANVVAGTLPITGATTTTPIVVTSPAHRVPLGRIVHGGIEGVVGMTELNGLMWVLTPLDDDTFSVSTFDAQGNAIPSVGVGTYDSGGTISYAFPDYAILLGRRNKLTATSVVSPRIVMIPTTGAAWVLEPYGGAAPNIAPADAPPARGSAEQQAMTLDPQINTEKLTFEVYINGSGPNFGSALAPDFEDFDATQRLAHAFFSELWDAMGGRARVLRESWPSQVETQGAMSQRGQQVCLVVEVQMPVQRARSLAFAPIGVRAEFTVQPEDPGPTDPIVFDVPPA